jgi:hypothetical protein
MTGQRRRLMERFTTLLADSPGRLERAAYILVFMILTAERLPEVIQNGRVWAEEGNTFLRNALILPWSAALLHPVGGYLNVIANLAGMVAADLVPVEQVRWVGPITGLLFQTIPAILLVTGGFPWLRSRIAQVCALLLITTAPLALEVWLNSLHPQFHLALCAALILAMPTKAGWAGRVYLGLILLAALCGPVAWLLLPLFAARAVIERSGPRLIQAVVLATGVLVQLIFFFRIDHTAQTPFNLSALVSAIFVKQVLVPLLDYRTTAALAAGLRQMAMDNSVPIVLATAETAVIIAGLLLLWRRGERSLFWMAAALVAILPSYGLARGGTLDVVQEVAGGRYAFVPQMLLAQLLLGVALTGRDGFSRVAGFFVAWMLVIGISEYPDYPTRSMFSHGPRWTREVAAWRRDHTHILRILPNGWSVDLNVDGNPAPMP